MNKNSLHTRVQVLETTMVLAAFFLVLTIATHKALFVLPALALLVVGLFLKSAASVITRAWLKFGEAIGGIGNKIILTLLYVVVLTPMALLYRLFTKNPLGIQRDDTAATYFHERNHTYSADDLEKMG